jgi:hypothetical protein
MLSSAQPPGRPFAHPLAYVRAQHGWSASALLRVIADYAMSELGVEVNCTDRNKVHRWEARGVTPDPVAQRALAHALEVPEKRLSTKPWPKWLPAYGGVRQLGSWSPTRTAQALTDAVDGGATDPRGYLGITGAELRRIAERWADSTPPALTAVVRGPGQVAEHAVAGLEDQSARLRRLETVVPVHTTGELADGQLRLALELLTSGWHGARTAQRLYRAVAEHAHLAAWAAYDTGRHFAAQRYFRAGLHAAHAVNDRPLGGYLLACMGYQAVVLGDPESGLRLAEVAASSGRAGASGRVTAMLASYRCLARLAAGEDAAIVVRAGPHRRRHATALRGLPTGEVGGSVGSSWLGWFTDVPAAAMASRRYLLLGDGSRAAPLLGRPIRGDAAAGRLTGTEPSIPRTHRQLHQLAERLAEAPATTSAVRELRALLTRAAA